MVHAQAAGFALDALDPDEALEFERHLLVCPACLDAVEPLRAAAAALAFAGDLAPPPAALRLRVLDVVEAVVVPIRRRWQRPVIAAAAAAAVVSAIVVGVHGSTTESSLAAGLHAYPVHAQSPTVQGDLVVTGAARDAVLAVRGLPEPPAGSVYELWIVRGQRATPAGFLRRGMGMLTRPLPRRASVAVSLEPAGGSRRPTGPLLITAETA
jgi:hypothetical protein